MPIFLIGYMACGKTTLGRALEAAGAAEFVDLDDFITEKSGLTPAEWFAKRGEKAFRQVELEALKNLSLDKPIIIATGGGTPANGDAMNFMLAHGTVVWLEASLDRTVRRLLEANGQRPIVAGMDETALRKFIPTHISHRAEFYKRAHTRFDSSYLDTAEEIQATVNAFRRQFGLN